MSSMIGTRSGNRGECAGSCRLPYTLEKDGKVISDISKVLKKSSELSENINIIGDTLVIDNGNELSENEFSKIKDFLKDGNNLILSNAIEGVSKFKTIAKINDHNELIIKILF